MTDQKKCSKCKQVKRLDQFRNERRGKLGKKSYCRECDDLYNKQHYTENREFRIMQIRAQQQT